ncbi:Sterol regulatory element-binding protein ECM22-like protein 1 [Pleurostoma richardsiae]|uniref:Sterol regulatory element-binding protein ECM22-like protein 1 n=1 Tax=Pleurostoma richardsiae TaxID=41990 RepID=A0AA38VQT4_9PEZI|nr:Sterol regulatory element-binding protein ECM22-like protein 1 [Pleurostoma richardsiae]
MAPDGVPEDTPHEPEAKKRRSHRKSRTGCQNCKKRRVKCDEVKPMCGGPATTAGSAAEGRSGLPLNIDDLELMYHFMSDSSVAFGSAEVWRNKFLRLGFDYHCILHLVLALSALHLQGLRPSKSGRYSELADGHMEIGLRQVTELLPSISKDNCSGLYIATVLVCVTTFAKGPRPGHLLVIAEGHEVAWWNLLRGVRFVVETIGGIGVVMGSLGLLPVDQAEKRDKKEEEKAEEPDIRMINDMVQWEEPLSKLSDIILQAGSVDVKLYQYAWDDLTGCFRETYGTVQDPNDASNGRFEVVIGWLYRMEDGFQVRLQDKQPIALILMAHYAVLLHTLEWMWCLRGWASHILAGIRDILDPEYVQWLDWPAEQIEAAEAARQNSACVGQGAASYVDSDLHDSIPNSN